jgi:hypothetical protein
VAALAGLLLVGAAGWGVTKFLNVADRFLAEAEQAGTSTKTRRRLLFGTIVLAWTGACFVAAWFAVHNPIRTRTDPLDRPEHPLQPAPSWLWQVGLGLGVVGFISFIVAVLTTPQPAEFSSRNDPAEQRFSVVRTLVWFLSGTWVAAIAASAAATQSDLRAIPLLFAAFFTVVIAVATWWRGDNGRG